MDDRWQQSPEAANAFGAPKRTPGPPVFSPERPLHPTLAPPRLRLAGYLIDVFGTLAAGAAIALVTIELGASDDDAAGYMVLGVVVLWVFQMTFVVGRTGGQSIGKLISGTRIVHEDGSFGGAGLGFRRDVLARLVVLIPLVGLIDGILVLNADRRSLRDRMVGSRVILAGDSAPTARAAVAAVAAVVLCMVAVGATPESWGEDSATDRADFIEECTADEDATRKQCGCFFDYMRDKLSYDDFRHYFYGAPWELKSGPAPERVDQEYAAGLVTCGILDSDYEQPSRRRS